MTHTIIAFDLGSNMAVAVNRPRDGKIVAMSQKFVGNRELRACNTLEWLTLMFSEGKFDAVIYERPFARGQNATRSLWGLAGLIEATATRAGLPVVDIDPSTVKSWATGKGNANKEDMILAAKLAGYEGDNEHEADAYCLCGYALEKVRFK